MNFFRTKLNRLTRSIPATVLLGVLFAGAASAGGYFLYYANRLVIQDNLRIDGKLSVLNNEQDTSGLPGDLLVGNSVVHDPAQKLHVCDKSGTDPCGAQQIVELSSAGLALKNKVDTVQVDSLSAPIIQINPGNKLVNLGNTTRIKNCYQNISTCAQDELVTASTLAGNITSMTPGLQLTLAPDALEIQKLYLEITKQNVCVLQPFGSACPTGYKSGGDPNQYTGAGDVKLWTGFTKESNGTTDKPNLCCKIDPAPSPAAVPVSFAIYESDVELRYDRNGPETKPKRAKFKVFLDGVEAGIFGYQTPNTATLYVTPNIEHALTVMLWENTDVLWNGDNWGDGRGWYTATGQSAAYTLNLSATGLEFTKQTKLGNTDACLGADFETKYGAPDGKTAIQWIDEKRTPASCVSKVTSNSGSITGSKIWHSVFDFVRSWGGNPSEYSVQTEVADSGATFDIEKGWNYTGGGSGDPQVTYGGGEPGRNIHFFKVTR